jgi:hypothetical protein
VFKVLAGCLPFLAFIDLSLDAILAWEKALKMTIRSRPRYRGETVFWNFTGQRRPSPADTQSKCLFGPLAVQGAELLLHRSNLVLTYYQQTMLTRCLKNSVFGITANRTGSDNRPRGTLTFTRQSQVVTPRGELVYRAGPECQELFIIQLDIGKTLDKSMTPRNDLF